MGPSIPKGFRAPGSFHCLCCINALRRCQGESLALVAPKKLRLTETGPLSAQIK